MQGVHNTEMQLQSLIDSLNRDRDRHLVLERTLADAKMAETLAVPVTPPAGKETAADQLRAAQEQLRAM